jgi:hypothetical protein
MAKAGKQPKASSIAYYSIQRLKSGRRSYSASTSDVLSPLARRIQGFSVTSLDTPIQGLEDDDGELTFGDMLACRRDDPASEACRRHDWDAFLDTQGDRDVAILRDIAAGERMTDIARRLKVSSPRICQIKDRLAAEILSKMSDILNDSMAEPLWRRDLRANKEKATFGDEPGSRKPRQRAA